MRIAWEVQHRVMLLLDSLLLYVGYPALSPTFMRRRDADNGLVVGVERTTWRPPRWMDQRKEAIGRQECVKGRNKGPRIRGQNKDSISYGVSRKERETRVTESEPPKRSPHRLSNPGIPKKKENGPENGGGEKDLTSDARFSFQSAPDVGRSIPRYLWYRLCICRRPSSSPHR